MITARERVYCFLVAIIGAILLSTLTTTFIPIILAFIIQLMFTSVISISCLGIIKDKKSKYNWCGLFCGIDACVMFTVFMIVLGEELNETMRIISGIILVVTFILLFPLTGTWYKYEEKEVDHKIQ